jgi:hypothetical protein
MSAVQALGAARAFGIRLELDGDDLLLEASAPPPDAVLEALSQHKATSYGYCTQPRISHRRSTGRSYSISVQPLLSSTVASRAVWLRLKPSNAASSNG